MAKHRSYARRQLRAAFLPFLRENVLKLAQVAVVLLGAVALNLWTNPGFVGGVVLGGVSMFFIGFVLFAFLIHTEGMQQLLGAWGEDNTASELERAKKRGYIWGWVDNIEVDRQDIDHLVIAPGGVIAIESKWHSRALTDKVLAWDAWQAERNAAKARSVMRATPVSMPHDARPVVAVWGRGHRELFTDSRTVEGVPVMSAHKLLDWLAQYKTGRLPQDEADELLARLRRFKRDQFQAELAHREAAQRQLT